MPTVGSVLLVFQPKRMIDSACSCKHWTNPGFFKAAFWAKDQCSVLRKIKYPIMADVGSTQIAWLIGSDVDVADLFGNSFSILA